MAEPREAQLEWEARAGRFAAGAGIASVLLLIAGTILEARALSSPSTDERNDDSELLRAIDGNVTDFIVSSVVQALSYLALVGVLVYLYRVTRNRRPELFQAALILGVAGPVLFAVAGVLLDISRVDLADQFVSAGEQTENRAEDLLDDRDAFAVGLGAGGTFALALAMVLLNMNAIRAGIVSRFLGVIGIIVGALYVLPLFQGPAIVQVFWLGALVMLFLDRWPGGRGPAWDSGEAVPWPSAAERRGLAPPGDGDEDEQESRATGASDDEGSPPVSRKRKRRA